MIIKRISQEEAIALLSGITGRLNKEAEDELFDIYFRKVYAELKKRDFDTLVEFIAKEKVVCCYHHFVEHISNMTVDNFAANIIPRETANDIFDACTKMLLDKPTDGKQVTH